MTNQTKSREERLRIAVDFDGVLFDHVPYVLRGFRDRLGIDLQAEGLRHWDYYHYRAVQDADIPFSAIRDVLRDIETDEALHREAPRDARAAKVMQKWMNDGHEVNIVTARSTRSEAAIRTFLETHKVPHHNIVMGARIKTGYDLLIDDAPHNVLMAAAGGGIALLMDHPYNRDVPTSRNPFRVRDWLEVEVAAAPYVMGLLRA